MECIVLQCYKKMLHVKCSRAVQCIAMLCDRSAVYALDTRLDLRLAGQDAAVSFLTDKFAALQDILVQCDDGM